LYIRTIQLGCGTEYDISQALGVNSVCPGIRSTIGDAQQVGNGNEAALLNVLINLDIYYSADNTIRVEGWRSVTTRIIGFHCVTVKFHIFFAVRLGSEGRYE